MDFGSGNIKGYRNLWFPIANFYFQLTKKSVTSTVQIPRIGTIKFEPIEDGGCVLSDYDDKVYLVVVLSDMSPFPIRNTTPIPFKDFSACW